MKKFLLLALAGLCLTQAPLTYAKGKKDQEESTEARDRLSSHSKYIFGAAALSLGAGFAMNSNSLKNAGIGLASGTACAYIENDIHWILAWLGEISLRNAVVRVTNNWKGRAVTIEDIFTAGLAGEAASWASYLYYRSLNNKAKEEAKD